MELAVYLNQRCKFIVGLAICSAKVFVVKDSSLYIINIDGKLAPFLEAHKTLLVEYVFFFPSAIGG